MRKGERQWKFSEKNYNTVVFQYVNKLFFSSQNYTYLLSTLLLPPVRPCMNYGRDFDADRNQRLFTWLQEYELILLLRALGTRNMREHRLLQLKRDNIAIRPPTAIDGWEAGPKKWPETTCTSIISCFINLAASEGEVKNNLKSSEAYQY